MNQNNVPVLLLTGYLGSGKTTLLNRILNNRRGIKFAVIVNDIGEVNIDASLIQRDGVVGNDNNTEDLIALQNGCICCTLQMDLVEQLSQLVNSAKFDYIVIEASGICEPEPIAQTITMMPRMEASITQGGTPKLDCIVTVVDALRMASEFDCGNNLTNDNIDDEDIENLIIEQIEFCNIILLNKISEVTSSEAGRIKAIIRAIQPKAEIIECDYADIDFNKILNTDSFDYEQVATSATWIREIEHHHEHCHDHDNEHECHHHHHHAEGEAEEYGIETMVYYRRPPFDINRLDYFIANKWPKNIIRCKGLVYFAHNRDMSCVFEQAGVQKKLTQSGLWYATAPKEEIEMMMQRDPSLRRDWDNQYGDRMIKLVIIGQKLDREAIATALDDCLAKF